MTCLSDVSKIGLQKTAFHDAVLTLYVFCIQTSNILEECDTFNGDVHNSNA